MMNRNVTQHRFLSQESRLTLWLMIILRKIYFAYTMEVK